MIYREEVTAILIVLGDINVKLQQMIDLWGTLLAKIRKTTPEQREQWRRNHEHLMEIIERRKVLDEHYRRLREQRASEPHKA